MENKPKFGYIILWRGKKYEVRSNEGRLSVTEAFCAEHRIRRAWEVSGFLVEVDGAQVTPHVD